MKTFTLYWATGDRTVEQGASFTDLVRRENINVYLLDLYVEGDCNSYRWNDKSGKWDLIELVLYHVVVGSNMYSVIAEDVEEALRLFLERAELVSRVYNDPKFDIFYFRVSPDEMSVGTISLITKVQKGVFA